MSLTASIASPVRPARRRAARSSEADVFDVDALLARSRPSRRAPDESRPASPRVLVADDSGDARYCLGRMLAQLGCRAESAVDGRDACDKVAAAGAAGAAYDLVLMDVTMPGVDGLTAARRVRSGGYAGTIVAITGDTFPATRDECLAAGCDDYHYGRLDFEAVVAVVTRHLPAARAAARRLAS
jgi:CheY-like chemotaxis protein